MTNSEKVRLAVVHCLRSNDCSTCEACPYNEGNDYGCMARLRDDIVTLLKAQEPMSPVTSEVQYGDHLQHCPSCGKALPNSGEYGISHYCYKCGQAVKWE